MNDEIELPEFLDRKKNDVQPILSRPTTCRACHGSGVIVGKTGVTFDCPKCNRKKEMDMNVAPNTDTKVKTHFKAPKAGSKVKGELPKVINKPFKKHAGDRDRRSTPKTDRALAKAKAAKPVVKAKREPGPAVAAIIKAAQTPKGATVEELHKASGWGATPWKQLFTHPTRGICVRFGFKYENIKKDGEPVRHRLIKK